MSKTCRKHDLDNITNAEKIIYIIAYIIKYYNNAKSSKIQHKKNINISKEKNMKKTISVPIVISEKYIDIPIEYKVNTDYKACEINNIKNDVYLEKSDIIPIKINDISMCNKGKVFISGFIKNRIEYSTLENVKENTISGEIKYITSYIPFKCTTYINFPNYMKINSQNKFMKSINCSIKKSNIIGTTLYDNKNTIKALNSTFKSFEEKIVLKLNLVFTQEDVVNICDILPISKNK